MKNRKGFTLVELLVTIVILGIVTGISIPIIRDVHHVDVNLIILAVTNNNKKIPKFIGVFFYLCYNVIRVEVS